MRKFNSLLLISLLAMSGPALAADAVEKVDPARHLAQFLEDDMGELMAENLAASGLAKQDIKRIVSQTINGLSRCVIAEIEKIESPYAREWLDLLSQAPSRDEVDAWERSMEAQDGYEGIDVQQELKACVLEFEQAAGLTPDAIGVR